MMFTNVLQKEIFSRVEMDPPVLVNVVKEEPMYR
jgi:hypothetical protein